jgi:hypothetical protein
LPGPKGEKGPKGDKGDRGEKGDPGENGVAAVKYPLVLDEGELSFDTAKIQDILSKLIKSKDDANQIAKNYGWLSSSGGGAVGIYNDGARVIKSVNDLNFKGAGVTVTRKGKQVDVEISGGGGGGPGSVGPTGPTGAVGYTGSVGIPYTISNYGWTANIGITGAGYLWGAFGTGGLSQKLSVASLDVYSSDKDPYYDFMRTYPATGLVGADKGFLFIQSRTAVQKVAVYGIGDIAKVGSGNTSFYEFTWSNTASVTAGFDPGEEVGIFYVPNGAKGAKGDPGDAVTSIDGGQLTIVVP